MGSLSFAGKVTVMVALLSTTAFSQHGSLPEFAMGSRAAALGNTATASFSDALAVSQNPASAIDTKKLTISAFYSSRQFDVTSTSIGFVLPTRDYGAYGIGYFSLGTEFTASDVDGNSLGNRTFSQKHLILSHARKIGSHFAWGANAKFVVQSMGDVHTGLENVGIDFGVHYLPRSSQPLLRNLAFGIVVDNLVRPTIDNEGLPREFRAVIEKQFFFARNRLNVVLNIVSSENRVHRSENDPQFVTKLSRPEMHFGVEYALGKYFFRSGYFSETFTAGFGLQIKSLQVGYGMNRSNTFTGLHANHAFSLDFAF